MRKTVYDEGYLKRIARIILAPVIALKPKNFDLKDFLEMVFCINSRIITRYYAKFSFKVVGLKYVLDAKKVGGYTQIVEPKDEIWVREDTTVPGKLDIEIIPVSNHREHSRWEVDKEFFNLVMKTRLSLKPFRSRKRLRSTWE